MRAFMYVPSLIHQLVGATNRLQRLINCRTIITIIINIKITVDVFKTK